MLNISLHGTVLRARARCVSLAVLAGLAGMPVAQADPAVAPEPAASAPFKHYQGWRDEPLRDWRQANERVGEIGGWRTYLREAQQDGKGADNGHAHHDH